MWRFAGEELPETLRVMSRKTQSFSAAGEFNRSQPTLRYDIEECVIERNAGDNAVAAVEPWGVQEEVSL
jgi:hypothetical protein